MSFDESSDSRASIIRSESILTANNNENIWAIFEFLETFSYISQLTVEMIPIDDGKK
jgi:hypothetical protein